MVVAEKLVKGEETGREQHKLDRTKVEVVERFGAAPCSNYVRRLQTPG
jgi:hypothetical protein